MPVKTITQYIDDFDGKVIDGEPDPVELVYEQKRYKLYLSDANKKKLDDFLSQYITDAEPVAASSARPGIGAKSDAQQRVEAAGKTFHDVKAWALAKNTYKTAKGEPISDAAPRLSANIWEDYAEAEL
jgi:hypothetical protein